jgi:hypothetical protein
MSPRVCPWFQSLGHLLQVSPSTPFVDICLMRPETYPFRKIRKVERSEVSLKTTAAIRSVDEERAPSTDAVKNAVSSLVIGQTARKSVKALFQYILSVAVNGGEFHLKDVCSRRTSRNLRLRFGIAPGPQPFHPSWRDRGKVAQIWKSVRQQTPSGKFQRRILSECRLQVFYTRWCERLQSLRELCP